MDGFAPVGSDAWTGGKEYEGEHAERICQFRDIVNQEALKAYTSKLRQNQPCTLSPEFSVGQDNLVRKIRFDDGVEWIARLRMPPMEGESSRPEATLLEMQSELATMEFVRQKTDIPIPRVYGYELDGRNSVGCPFSIMEYIDGNTAEEVSRTYPGGHEGIPTQFEQKFWRQIAEIMIKLAAIRLPEIGSVTLGQADQGSFVVGPLIGTSSGPYASAAAFYADYPLALGRSLANGGLPVDGQDELVEAFRSLAASFPPPAVRAGKGGPADGFGLANFDLNPNNVLVDREFNVLAVIDWDSVVAVPDAALYRIPFLMGTSCAVPGVLDECTAVRERQLRARRFAGVVEAVGRERGRNDREGVNKQQTFLLTEAGFFSKEALAFRSLTYVKMRQDFVNESWLQGLKWLSEHDEAEVAQFYLEN
ncbi:kinase-like domain-containing protein [Durotheca rogersii]|uniref:kinase-like domain-containing protein n=1 Tax=Durotheca rogersii TaxID=419775 RepID=UPI00221F9A59|nr:kinase-like domain-containing protein [Durotheca rogersii]KAI5861327.1 kinase-like domain-containing protein [Durotheca rogersii]